jgi:hypothetical protein
MDEISEQQSCGNNTPQEFTGRGSHENESLVGSSSSNSKACRHHGARPFKDGSDAGKKSFFKELAQLPVCREWIRKLSAHNSGYAPSPGYREAHFYRASAGHVVFLSAVPYSFRFRLPTDLWLKWSQHEK